MSRFANKLKYSIVELKNKNVTLQFSINTDDGICIVAHVKSWNGQSDHPCMDNESAKMRFTEERFSSPNLQMHE